jgi:hypothetical protein
MRLAVGFAVFVGSGGGVLPGEPGIWEAQQSQIARRPLRAPPDRVSTTARRASLRPNPEQELMFRHLSAQRLAAILAAAQARSSSLERFYDSAAVVGRKIANDKRRSEPRNPRLGYP